MRFATARAFSRAVLKAELILGAGLGDSYRCNSDARFRGHDDGLWAGRRLLAGRLKVTIEEKSRV